jgi:hypothetical protein
MILEIARPSGASGSALLRMRAANTHSRGRLAPGAVDAGRARDADRHPGGGPDAGPTPGDVSAGDGLPPVRDSYGLDPATVPPLT